MASLKPLLALKQTV